MPRGASNNVEQQQQRQQTQQRTQRPIKRQQPQPDLATADDDLDNSSVLRSARRLALHGAGGEAAPDLGHNLQLGFWASARAYAAQCDRKALFRAWSRAYVDAHPPGSLEREAARALVARIKYVPLREFAHTMVKGLARLRRAMAREGVRQYTLVVLQREDAREVGWASLLPPRYHNNPNLNLEGLYAQPTHGVVNYKSVEWLSGLVARELARDGGPVLARVQRVQGCDENYLEDDVDFIPPPPRTTTDTHYVYVDDAAFSGAQVGSMMCANMADMLDNSAIGTLAKLWVMVPYQTRAGHKAILEDAHRISRDYVDKFMKRHRGVVQVLPPLVELPDAEQVTGELRIVGMSSGQGKSLTLFEHKAPDSTSFPRDLAQGVLLQRLVQQPPALTPLKRNRVETRASAAARDAPKFRFNPYNRAGVPLNMECPAPPAAAAATGSGSLARKRYVTDVRPYDFNAPAMIKHRLRLLEKSRALTHNPILALR